MTASLEQARSLAARLEQLAENGETPEETLDRLLRERDGARYSAGSAAHHAKRAGDLERLLLALLLSQPERRARVSAISMAAASGQDYALAKHRDLLADADVWCVVDRR